MKELIILWDIDTNITERAFLSWEEVREMAKSGIISFGSHTNNHRILTYLNQDDIFNELILSKEILISENIVNKTFISFCYPNGIYNESIAKMVKKAGYHAAVTTNNGWNLHNASLYCLKRVAIHQDVSSSKDMFGCRISNII